MKDKGYCGIGIYRPKTETNYWSLFRTAQILDVDFVFVIGPRYKTHCADTMKAYKHVPTFSYTDFNDFNEHRPFSCELVGIELTSSATEISKFSHPRSAVYLLGAEDVGLSKECLTNCQRVVKLYGDRSMNVAVAGSIVLYDRYSKGRSKNER